MKIIILLFTFFTLCSCGKSPLLKEVNAITSKQEALETKPFFRTSSETISINWLTNMNTAEEGRAIVVLAQNGRNIDSGYEFNAYIWMKSMGHGSAPITVTRLASGIYLLDEIYFSMSGDWQLHLTISKNNKIIEDVEIPYNVVD